MITSIEIENFRGIGSGSLAGLAPLTILTGPNGCGKSGVLDALLIGSSWLPDEAIVTAVQRHPRTVDGGRWLFLDRSKPAVITVRSPTSKPEACERRLSWIEHVGIEPEFERLASRQAPGPYRQVSCRGQDGNRLAQVFLAIDNSALTRKEARVPSPATVSILIDSSIPRPLEDEYSEVWRKGKREEALDLMRHLVPGLQSIDILTEANREPRLYLTGSHGAVPVSLSGDGIQALLQMILELALVPPEGLGLVEEPEVFLHPRAIYQCGRALVEGMRQGRQIVVTTHSLELIDAILGYCSPEDDRQIALFNLRLNDGKLESGRFDGKDMRTARNVIEEDLR